MVGYYAEWQQGKTACCQNDAVRNKFHQNAAYQHCQRYGNIADGRDKTENPTHHSVIHFFLNHASKTGPRKND